MLNPNEWGDQIVLHLASNLLEVEIQIIPAFRESASDPGTGLTIIEPHITTARHGKIYIFHFSESDFLSPHYQSVWPRKVSQTLSCSPLSPLQSDFEVTGVLETKKNISAESSDSNPLRQCKMFPHYCIWESLQPDSLE